MKFFMGFLGFFLCLQALAATESLPTISVKTYAQIMKKALDAKDAPAACWYLGISEGYLKALKSAGNEKASQLWSSIQGAEGKCGGKNTMDLKATFTPEEWTRLSELQKKLETADL